jgi:hypothetical protein
MIVMALNEGDFVAHEGLKSDEDNIEISERS